MAFSLVKEVTHEELCDVLLKNQDHMTSGSQRTKERDDQPSVTIQFSDYTDDEILALGADVDATIGNTECNYNWLTLYAVRPDSQDGKDVTDTAGFWGDK